VWFAGPKGAAPLDKIMERQSEGLVFWRRSADSRSAAVGYVAMAELTERQKDAIRRAAVVADKNGEALKRLRESDLPAELDAALRAAQEQTAEFERSVRMCQQRADEG
jgi:hypothetical protein